MSLRRDAWHLDTDLRDRYVDGTLTDAAAWSVEAHAAQCPRCRAGFPVGARLESVWEAVEDDVERTSRRPRELLLIRVGVPEHVARLLLATPALTAAWSGALVAVLGLALAAAHLVGGPVSNLPFLVVAPLTPLAGVAAAFGPRIDPAYEIGLAAPVRGVRIVLLRAMPTAAMAVLVAALLSVFLRAPGLGALAWLLPALAVSATALALSSWWSPLVAATATGLGWLSIVVVAELVTTGPGRGLAATDAGAVFGAAGQLAAVVVLIASSVLVRTRRDAFDRVASG